MTSYSTQDYNEDYIKWANQELTSKDETIRRLEHALTIAKKFARDHISGYSIKEGEEAAKVYNIARAALEATK